MPRRKFFAIAILLLSLALLEAGAAQAAILQKGSQIVNLAAPAANNGEVAFSDLNVVSADGSLTPFVLPANTVLIISHIRWNFTPKGEVTGLVQFNLGEYYRIRTQLNNIFNFYSTIENILPGVAATNMSARIFLERVGDPNRTPITGTLNMSLVCYTAPDN